MNVEFDGVALRVVRIQPRDREVFLVDFVERDGGSLVRVFCSRDTAEFLRCELEKALGGANNVRRS